MALRKSLKSDRYYYCCSKTEYCEKTKEYLNACSDLSKFPDESYTTDNTDVRYHRGYWFWADSIPNIDENAYLESDSDSGNNSSKSNDSKSSKSSVTDTISELGKVIENLRLENQCLREDKENQNKKIKFQTEEIRNQKLKIQDEKNLVTNLNNEIDSKNEELEKQKILIENKNLEIRLQNEENKSLKHQNEFLTRAHQDAIKKLMILSCKPPNKSKL